MKHFFAQLISIVFQPLLLPLYGTVYIIRANPFMFPDTGQNIIDILRIALNTFFFPAIIVLLMAGLKFVKGVNLRDRQDRVIPYVAAMMCYIWTFYVYYHSGFNRIITFILLGSCIAIVLAFLINILVMKVSMHTTGAGGMIAMMLILIPVSHDDPLVAFLTSIFIAGAIGSARLALHAHSNREVYYGYLTGFFSFMLATNIFRI